MREPREGTIPFGLVAEFDAPERLLDGVKAARKAGYRAIDASSPFPVDGVAEALGLRRHAIGWLMLAGGIGGLLLGWAIQAYAIFAYPIPVGARPPMPLQAFALIMFELMVLGAVLSGIIGMFAMNRLPRLHHPLFDVPDFEFASSRRFFLVVFANDPKFDPRRTGDFLKGLKPLRVASIEPELVR